jgi:hypothetical protein
MPRHKDKEVEEVKQKTGKALLDAATEEFFR